MKTDRNKKRKQKQLIGWSKELSSDYPTIPEICQYAQEHDVSLKQAEYELSGQFQVDIKNN